MTADSVRTRNTEATRQQILDAAEKLFVKHGLNGTTMAQIAEAANVSKGLIHHHFGKKDALWDEVKTRRFNIYAAAQLRLLSAPEAENELLRLSMVEYFRFLQRNPGFLRLLTWMQLEGDTAEREPSQELIETGVARVCEAQAQGRLRADVDPRNLLAVFLGAIRHWFYARSELFFQGKTPDPRRETAPTLDEAYLEDMTKILFGGVLPRENPSI